MKILHVISNLGDGGAEGVLFRLVTADKKFNHVVISMDGSGKYGPMMESCGVDLFVLNMGQWRLLYKNIFLLFKLIRQVKPDVLQTWMPHADLVAGVIGRLTGLKSIFWGVRHSSLDREKANGLTVKIVRVNSWLSNYVPSGIISCAQSAADIHIKHGFPSEKMSVVYNGFDTSKFRVDDKKRCDFRGSISVEEGEFLIGMVARYDPQKNHFGLLHSLQLLTKQGYGFKCVLVGSGLTHENLTLSQKIKELGLQEIVILTGQCLDVSSVMNGIDLHVLPSVYGEAFPNVVAEAMACGTPCLATDVGDASNIIGDTGWIVKAGDCMALANGIQNACNEWRSGNWLKRSLSARERIKNHFGLQLMVDSFHRIWTKVD